MDSTISPKLQAKITQTNANNSSKVQYTKQNLTTEPDSVELSTKPKMSKGKKALIIAGATVGALAVTAGVIALVHKGQIKSIQKEGAAIQEKGQKVVDEFMEKFKNVQPMEDGRKIIEEFAQDGKTPTRVATLCQDEFLWIEDDTNKTIINTKEGVLTWFYKKVSPSLNPIEDGFQYKKGFSFENGKLSGFHKNHRTYADHSSSTDKIMSFKDGQLIGWCKNHKWDENGVLSIKKGINFKDGKLETIAKNAKYQIFGDGEADKVAFFKDGKLEKLIKDYHIYASGKETYGKIKYFGKNK